MPKREVAMGLEIKRTPQEQMDLIMGIILDLQMAAQKMGRELHEQMDKKVDAALESKIPVIQGREALREAVKLKQLLIERGVITAQEFEAKLRE
jgi:hypothetical protein